MAIKSFQCTRNSLISVIRPTMVGHGEKIFKTKVLRKLENAILRLVFGNIVLHKLVTSQKVC